MSVPLEAHQQRRERSYMSFAPEKLTPVLMGVWSYLLQGVTVSCCMLKLILARNKAVRVLIRLVSKINSKLALW